MSPTDYEAAKFELAQILRAAIALAADDRHAIREQAREVFARIAEDRFNLLVIGRFSRGKSSLMNAVLGTDRLPTGVLPVTSVITSVEYAQPEALLIEYHGNRFGFEVPMQNLAEYTTERGNPGNRREVRVARVGLPVEILRRGFFFVDSPGLGSAITQNTRTTEAFLPEADAIVMVSGYDGPLSDDEVRALRLLEDSRLRLFFVLNKQDTVSAAERQEVGDYVRGRLRELWAGNPPQVFSLSALDALAARAAHDPRALEASGVPDLERELTRFLIEERGAEFIRGACERVLRVVGLLDDSAAARPLRERIAAVRGGASRLELQGEPVIKRPVRPRELVRTWGTCELCARIHEALFQFLIAYQHELAVLPEAAQTLAQAGGLCGPHLRLYASLATERDLCVALTPLVTHWVGYLRDLPLAARPSMPVQCRLCDLQREVEARIIGEWLLADAQGSAALADHCLCLAHLQRVVADLSDPEIAAALIRNQASALERLSEDMQRHVIKHDGTRRALTTQEESQAAQRAIALLAARHSVVIRDGGCARRSRDSKAGS